MSLLSDWSSLKIWPVSCCQCHGSCRLSSVENDLTQVIKDVTVALSAMENMRSEAGFQKIFAEASLLAEHHGIAVSSPRLSKGRSVYRSTVGVEGDCTETYYRINGHQQRVYSVSSAVDSDCSRTQRPDAATAALSSCSSVSFQTSLPTAVHPRNAARNDVRV